MCTFTISLVGVAALQVNCFSMLFSQECPYFNSGRCTFVGVHVTLPDYYSPEHLGMIVPKTKDGRVVFMLPWLEATIAGTTGHCSPPPLSKPICCSQLPCSLLGCWTKQVVTALDTVLTGLHQIAGHVDLFPPPACR